MKCEVIRDLMPLYLDECCSESSRELVEEHLKECDCCRKMAEQMRKELIVGTEEKQYNVKERESQLLHFPYYFLHCLLLTP